MSKRELVSYIHALTGLSYKESRILCKNAKYNKLYALYFAYLGLNNRVILSASSEDYQLK